MQADSANGELVISHIGASIKILQIDGRGEYISASLQQFLSSKGIIALIHLNKMAWPKERIDTL